MEFEYWWLLCDARYVEEKRSILGYILSVR